jgi:ribosomal protein L12E/L44/L45/RPP1/RPP2
VHEIIIKCLLLYKELKQAQKTISNYNLTLKKSKRGITTEKAQLKEWIKDLKGRRDKVAH